MIPISRLIPHLSELRWRLLPEDPDNKYAVIATHLDMLPFALGAAGNALEQGIQAQREVELL